MAARRWRSGPQTFLASLAFRHENLTGIVAATLATVFATLHFAEALVSGVSLSGADDAILQARFSSPAASDSIVILDIDERSLALMAPDYGRWPWPREVHAEALESILAEAPASVLFNVMISDPDLSNPDGDALLDYVASTSDRVVYPLIRLNPDNDSASDLTLASLPGSVPAEDGGEQGATLAAILPGLSGMLDRIGVTNNDPDDDGILRRYRYRPEYNGWELPSMASSAIEAAGLETSTLPDTYVLNWRNKRGGYQRISMGDYLLNGEGQGTLGGKFVVIGVSAPGVGQVIPTGVAKLQDSNEILATALDDAINDTWLRLLPSWGEFLLSLVAAWGLLLARYLGVEDDALEISFVVIEFSLAAICLVAVSYANLLIDVAYPMGIMLGVFASLEISGALAKRWGSAYRGFRDQVDDSQPDCMVIGISPEVEGSQQASNLPNELRKVLGWKHLIKLDSIVEGGSLVADSLKGMDFYCGAVSEAQKKALEELVATAEPGLVSVRFFSTGMAWLPSDPLFRRIVTVQVLDAARELVEWSLRVTDSPDTAGDQT